MTAGAYLSGCEQNTLKRYEQILMKLLGYVDNGPWNRLIHFGVVAESDGTLTFDLPKIIGLDQRPRGFESYLLCYVTLYYCLYVLCYRCRSQYVGKLSVWSAFPVLE